MTISIEQLDSMRSIFLNRGSPVKENSPYTNDVATAQGLDFILNHFETPILPRTASTKTTEGKQVLVYNKEESLASFKAAELS